MSCRLRNAGLAFQNQKYELTPELFQLTIYVPRSSAGRLVHLLVWVRSKRRSQELARSIHTRKAAQAAARRPVRTDSAPRN